jgi:hypothetical protein
MESIHALGQHRWDITLQQFRIFQKVSHLVLLVVRFRLHEARLSTLGACCTLQIWDAPGYLSAS